MKINYTWVPMKPNHEIMYWTYSFFFLLKGRQELNLPNFYYTERTKVKDQEKNYILDT